MFFCSIEGMDASGKASQSKLLADWFETQGTKVLRTSFPAYESVTGKAIKAHLLREWQVSHSATSDWPERRQFDPLVFQALQICNRFENLPVEAFQNPPNTVLVSDRYHASALVYGGLDGLDLDLLNRMNIGLPMPNLYLLLDIPVEASVQRRPDRRDRYEKDLPFLKKVRDRYIELFQEKATSRGMLNKTRWVVIDGTQSMEEVHQQILREVRQAGWNQL